MGFLLVLVSCFYAGSTSNIFFGVRGYDLLLFFLIAFCTNRNEMYKLSYREFILYLLLVVLLSIGIYFGYYNNNVFLLSGSREWIILMATIYVAIRSSLIVSLSQVQRTFELSVLFIISLYVILFFYKPLYYYYASVEHLEKMTDQSGRIHGPSSIFITYLFLSLTILGYKVKRNLKIFLFLTAFIFLFTQSRQLLVIMSGSVFLSLLLLGYIRRFIIWNMVLSPVVIYWLYISNDQMAQRLLNIFDPYSDSSFMYRILSNSEFMSEFFQLGMLGVIFGLGFGAEFTIFMGDYIGYVKLVILDNSLLTLLMRVGFLGLIVFYSALFIYSRKIPMNINLFLWFPLVISSALSAHLVTNPLYLFGFIFSCTSIYRYKALH